MRAGQADISITSTDAVGKGTFTATASIQVALTKEKYT